MKLFWNEEIYSLAVQFFNNTTRSALECYAKTLCIWKWWKLLTLESRELAFATHLHTLQRRARIFMNKTFNLHLLEKTLSFQLSSSFVWWCFFLPSSSFPRAIFSFSIWTSWVEKEKDKWEECNAIECVVNGENGNAIFVHSSELFFPVKNYFLFPPLEQQLAAAPPFYFSLLVEISDSVFPQHHLSFRAIHLTMQTTQLSQFRQTSTLFCWASGNNRAWARALTRRKCAGKSFVWANCAVE